MSHTIKIADIEHLPYSNEWNVVLYHNNGQIARVTRVKTERGALRIMDRWSRFGETKGAKRDVYMPIQYMLDCVSARGYDNLPS